MAEAGWYPNPDGTGGLRLYDGSRWTPQVKAAPTTPRPSRDEIGPAGTRIDETTRSRDVWNWSPAGLLTVAAGAATEVGSLMSWAHRGAQSVAGVRSDGRITVVLGAILVGVGAYLVRRGAGRGAALAVWVLVSQIAAIDLIDAASVLRKSPQTHFALGPGLYVVSAAVALGCVAALLATP